MDVVVPCLAVREGGARVENEYALLYEGRRRREKGGRKKMGSGGGVVVRVLQGSGDAERRGVGVGELRLVRVLRVNRCTWELASSIMRKEKEKEGGGGEGHREEKENGGTRVGGKRQERRNEERWGRGGGGAEVQTRADDADGESRKCGG